MKWMIQSFVGVGPLSFGMSRNEVHAKIGEGKRFRKASWSTTDTESYPSLGLNAYYEENDDSLVFVEFWGGGVEFEFEDLGNLFTLTYGELVELMTYNGYEPTLDNYGCKFADVGMSVYAPGGDLQGIGVFKRGYNG